MRCLNQLNFYCPSSCSTCHSAGALPADDEVAETFSEVAEEAVEAVEEAAEEAAEVSINRSKRAPGPYSLHDN